MEKTVMGFTELLSGLIGALLASLLAIWYQNVAEVIENRKHVMIAVTEWLDNIYLRLQLLSSEKELVYQGQESTLSQQEYNSMSNEMRILLLSNKIITEVACVYGQGDRLQKISQLQSSMTNAARIFWTARQEIWGDSHKKIMEMFETSIDPLRASVMNDFFNSLKEFSISDLAKKKLKIFCRCKH
jgi:hypothetical protein